MKTYQKLILKNNNSLKTDGLVFENATRNFKNTYKFSRLPRTHTWFECKKMNFVTLQFSTFFIKYAILSFLIIGTKFEGNVKAYM